MLRGAIRNKRKIRDCNVSAQHHLRYLQLKHRYAHTLSTKLERGLASRLSLSCITSAAAHCCRSRWGSCDARTRKSQRLAVRYHSRIECRASRSAESDVHPCPGSWAMHGSGARRPWNKKGCHQSSSSRSRSIKSLRATRSLMRTY